MSISGDEIAAPAKQGSPHHWQFSKAHTGSRFTYSFQYSVRVWLYNNYAGNKQKSYKIIITRMFVILGKVKPSIESIRGLYLMVVKHMTVQVTRLS
jgi:hypothetical protein